MLLAFAIARRWPTVASNTVEPGWVSTKMGEPWARDDLYLAHRTQVWLATADETSRTTGQHFYQHQPKRTHPAASSVELQENLLAVCAELSSVPLPD